METEARSGGFDWRMVTLLYAEEPQSILPVDRVSVVRHAAATTCSLALLIGGASDFTHPFSARAADRAILWKALSGTHAAHLRQSELQHAAPPTLRSTLSSASRADFCVGYFNLRGWRYLAPVVDGWGADAGPRPPQASVDRPASEGTSDAIDWATPRVLGHALATSDAGRDAGGPRSFNDAPSWSGVKHAAADRLRAGNDRTTSRPLRPPGSSRRGTCRDAVYAACNTPRSQAVHPALAAL